MILHAKVGYRGTAAKEKSTKKYGKLPGSPMASTFWVTGADWGFAFFAKKKKKA